MGQFRCVAVLLILFAGCSWGEANAQTDRPAGAQRAAIEKLVVSADQVTLRGTRPAGEVRLVEFPIWADAARVDQAVCSQSLLAGESFDLALPRFVDSPIGKRDRLLSRWAVVCDTRDGAEVFSAARYVDEVVVVTQAPSRPRLRGKKGLGGFDVGRGPVADLEELGIATVTVNLPLSFLSDAATADTEPFEYCGQTFHVHLPTIRGFDATLRAAAERDLLVFGILLVPPPRADSAVSRAMAHPDYDVAGVFAMPNVTSAEGVRAYGAALEYLARRYSRANGAYGRIHHWIAHNEVDAGWVWTNAGQKSARDYMALYHKSLRMIDLVARQYDPAAQAFISLTHAWTEIEDPQHYLSRELLALLVEISRAETDFAWGVAFHPYPQSLFEPATWNDEKAQPVDDTPFITFRNIEVLAAWARDPAHQFRGARRPIFLTEQGFNSKDYSEEQLQLQAAAMAYAWQKCADLPEIDGFHYHNWIDNRGEGGLRIGLRKFHDDADDPLGKKPIWHVYQALGTTQEADACQFALPIVGVDDWADENRPSGSR